MLAIPPMRQCVGQALQCLFSKLHGFDWEKSFSVAAVDVIGIIFAGAAVVAVGVVVVVAVVIALLWPLLLMVLLQ